MWDSPLEAEAEAPQEVLLRSALDSEQRSEKSHTGTPAAEVVSLEKWKRLYVDLKWLNEKYTTFLE